MDEKVRLEESVSWAALASSGVQKNQEAASSGCTRTRDQTPIQRSSTQKEDSRMEDKGKQNEPYVVAKDETATDSSSSENIGEKKNTQQGSTVQSVAPSSASDRDIPPARVISLVGEARRIINTALEKVDKVEETHKGLVSSQNESEITRKFLESSLNLFRHINGMLQKSNPEKEKFTALIVTQYYNFVLVHKTFLSRIGNWDVEETGTGEAAIESHIDGKSFDLIILHDDLVGLDGPRVTDWFRDHDVKTLIVGVSAFGKRSLGRNAFIKTGLNFCLKKPMILYYNETLSAITQQFSSQLYDIVRGEVNQLGNIVSGMERILGIGYGGSSSRGKQKK